MTDGRRGIALDVLEDEAFASSVLLQASVDRPKDRSTSGFRFRRDIESFRFPRFSRLSSLNRVRYSASRMPIMMSPGQHMSQSVVEVLFLLRKSPYSKSPSQKGTPSDRSLHMDHRARRTCPPPDEPYDLTDISLNLVLMSPSSHHEVLYNDMLRKQLVQSNH